jgi:hypothetical protein
MVDYKPVVREILRELLSRGPQRGALLKLVFSREFERQSNGVSYQQAFWNYQKFTDLLVANSDLFEVQWPEGPGDVTVKLRDAAPSLALIATQPADTPAPQGFVRSDLWNAFTNPDPNRRRFIHRLSGEIVHFLAHSGAELDRRIADQVATDGNFVEIQPARAEEQHAWMAAFIASSALPESKRRLVSDLINLPYSSRVNAIFLAALGEFAEGWRQYRSARVFDVVKRWRDETNFSSGLLLGPKSHIQGPVRPPAPPPTVPDPSTLVHTADGPAEAELRRLLHVAIDGMDHSELARVTLPATALLRTNAKR